VLDTLSSDHGRNAPSPAQVVYRRGQGNVMLLDGQVLSIAHISDLPTKPANVKLNPAPSTDIGDRGHHGQLVPSHADEDRRRSRENAIHPHHNMAEENVQDTIRSKLYVRSNHVLSMEDGHNGMNGEHAARVVEVESNNEHVNAPTLRPNMVADNALVSESTPEPATQNSVPSMVDGQSGACGGHAPRHVVVDEHTDYVDAPNHHPSMEVKDAQVHQYNLNNVEPSSARSTEDGVRTLHTALVPRPVVVEPLQAFATATTLLPSTTDFPALEQHSRPKHATRSTVLRMEDTPHGRNGHSAASPVVVELRPETASAHLPDTVVKDAKFLVMPQTNENATRNCVR